MVFTFWTRIRELGAVPEVQVTEAGRSESTAVDLETDVESTAVDSEAAADPESTAVDSEIRSSERLRYLERALRTLGFSAPEAKRRLERAWASFEGKATEFSDENLVKIALRMRAA